ncbi:MAG: hypothetical protein HZC40_15930 [Chloroflexi bacterium]|nr:hypothetical protein [Chloroflexota bacterium]
MINPTMNPLIVKIELDAQVRRILYDAEINRLLCDAEIRVPNPIARWTRYGLGRLGHWLVLIGNRLESLGAQRAQIA